MTKIVLIAGEPSGDALGASLIRALREKEPTITLSGIGGWRMGEAGVQSLFPIDDLSVMGLFEVLPKLFKILKKVQQTVDYIKETKPDIVVTIDSPDFCLRVARQVKEEMGADAPRLIHYVAPSVWAWREGRAQAMAEYLDGVICLFDFEPAFFEKHQLNAVTVGHPIVERDAMNADGAIYRDETGITLREMTIGVLMGSRASEIARHDPLLGKAARLMAEQLPGDPPHLIVPTLPHVEHLVWGHLKSYPGPVHITRRFDLKWHAFKAMDVAMAVSGTVGLELAVLNTPHLIAYRMNPLTYQIAKHMVKTKYAHLVNIILNKRIIPEFIQRRAKSAKIAEEALFLLTDQRTRQRQYEAFEEVRQRIGVNDDKTPSQKAAEFILSSLSS